MRDVNISIFITAYEFQPFIIWNHCKSRFSTLPDYLYINISMYVHLFFYLLDADDFYSAVMIKEHSEIAHSNPISVFVILQLLHVLAVGKLS